MANDDAATQLATLMMFSPDTFDFTTEPTAPVPGELIEFTFREIEFDSSIDDLAVDPNNPNAEVDHTEFQIVKLLDASTPKVTDDAFDFKPELTSEPTAPEPYATWTFKDLMVSSYQMSNGDRSTDTTSDDLFLEEISFSYQKIDLPAAPTDDGLLLV
jgi:type VI protein secretion system component Hcp